MQQLVNVDLDRFTTALADRLAEIAPANVTVDVVDQLIVFRLAGGAYEGGTDPATPFSGPTANPGESLSLAASNALSDLQDYICETTTDPWPLAIESDGRRMIANPHSEVRGERVVMWFGDESNPVIVVRDLMIDEFVVRD